MYWQFEKLRSELPSNKNTWIVKLKFLQGLLQQHAWMLLPSLKPGHSNHKFNSTCVYTLSHHEQTSFFFFFFVLENIIVVSSSGCLSGTGSGQQSVTGVTAVEDSNSYWSVRGTSGALCHRGTPVRCGQAIRLTHVNTGRNLHSHYFSSPLSSNQVSGGEPHEGMTSGAWCHVKD